MTVRYVATKDVPVDQLTPYPGNARRGDVPRIQDSIRRHGQYRSLVVQKLDDLLIILAGNHTHAALTAEGYATARCEIIECTPDEAARINLADNRMGELGGYDDDALTALLQSLGGDYDGTGYSQDDLDALLDLVDEQNPDDTDLDELPDNVPALARPGDLWLLGPHRLACGDSTSDTFLRFALGELAPGIVYTDPPYGINAVPKDGGASRGSKNRKRTSGIPGVAANVYAPIIGDDTTTAARDAFALLTTTFPDARQVWWGGNHYAGSAELPDSSCWLVWDKENGTNDFADAELAWTNYPGAVRIFRHMWNGMLRASEREKRVHPTQKPVALAQWAFGIVDPQAKETVVLDVFGGSGSTLIAAHETSRTAVIVEMEPHYVDVICRRWQGLTGELPQRYRSDGDPEPIDFT